LSTRIENFMTDKPLSSRRKSAQLLFFRLAAGGAVPARWFERGLPPPEARAARTGHLTLEIVSHCWNYSHFLAYQLSSLVNFPPTWLSVTMTVFYSPEDRRTASLLAFFEKIEVPGVTWNWQPLPKDRLFRRAIGRNQAALATQADWVWFTDCDLMFRDGCLDVLADQLQGRRDALLYPREERCTSLLADDDPMLSASHRQPQVLDIDASQFATQYPSRATGPLQIAHGDVCRAVGYCNALKFYQEPSDSWCKAHEDRAFRWLLGTQGTPLDIPGVYRIKHVYKGRYTGNAATTRARSGVRRVQSWLRG
jgi:hypothetical protein